MRRCQKRRKFVWVCLIILTLTIGLFGIKTGRWNFSLKDTATAISATEGLKLIEEKNLINNEMNKRIKDRKIKEKEKEIREQNALNQEDKKIAYLTFDDGPSTKSTPMVLDVLKKYDIKATFFVVGTMVEQNPDILKRVYDEGHQIGNHTYSHNYNYIYKNANNFMNDVYKLEKLIKSTVGEEFDSKVIRFPGGSFEKKKNPMKKLALDSGYRYFDWNALNGDAEGSRFSEGHLLNRLKETVEGKEKVVILMHDTDPKITTAKSLDKSIEFLLSEGYEFQILDKNFSWE